MQLNYIHLARLLPISMYRIYYVLCSTKIQYQNGIWHPASPSLSLQNSYFGQIPHCTLGSLHRVNSAAFTEQLRRSVFIFCLMLVVPVSQCPQEFWVQVITGKCLVLRDGFSLSPSLSHTQAKVSSKTCCSIQLFSTLSWFFPPP